MEPASRASAPGGGWIFSAILLPVITVVPFLILRFDQISESAEPVPVATHRLAPARRVMVIVVDGLGLDSAISSGLMPKLKARAKKSAFGVALASYPTVTVSGVRALFAGYWPSAKRGVPLAMAAATPAKESDSVFARATVAELNSIVIGPAVYDSLFGGQAAKMEIVNGHTCPPNFDGEVLRLGQEALDGRQGPWDLLVMHLFDLDIIGHCYGSINIPLHRRKLRWLDETIEALAARAGPDTMVILTADHGQTAKGSHGGAEAVVRHIPFLMWGPLARPGKIGTVVQSQTASTIAVLLGLAPPVKSEGEPIWQALAFSPRDRAAAALDVAKQHERKWLAAQADWPWLRNRPDAGLFLAQQFWLENRFGAAAAAAEEATDLMDEAVSDFTPRRWFGHLVALVVFLVLAALFGVIWPRHDPILGRIAAWLAGGAVLALILPLAHPGFWPFASQLAAWSGAGVLLCSLLPGFAQRAVRHWPEALLAVIALAFPPIIDLNAWAWLAVCGICLTRFRRPGAGGRRAVVWGMAAVAACALLTFWIQGSESSLLRSLLPSLLSGRNWTPPWEKLEAFLLLVACVFYWREVHAQNVSGKTLAGVAALWPALVSIFLPPTDLSGLAWTSGACWLSLGACFLFPLTVKDRMRWCSILGLVFGRTFTSHAEFCFLVLATIVGWCFARAEKESPWEGLAFFGLMLWAYSMPEGRLDLGHLSPAAAAEAMGAGWNPSAVMAMVVFKHLLVIGTPLLAWAATLSFEQAAAAMPFVGAISCGNLAFLWFNRFISGTSEGAALWREHGYELSAWSALLGWILLAVWGISRFGAARLARPASAPVEA